MRIDSQQQRTCLKHMHVSLGHDGIITASMFYPHKSGLGWSRPASLSSICIDGNIGSYVWSNPVFTKKAHHVMMSRPGLDCSTQSIQESSIPILEPLIRRSTHCWTNRVGKVVLLSPNLGQEFNMFNFKQLPRNSTVIRYSAPNLQARGCLPWTDCCFKTDTLITMNHEYSICVQLNSWKYWLQWNSKFTRSISNN